ncbi:acyl transferase/acyl hydrolase/lysophospholipase [Podospora fimiseda]|uniref:Acyl transferase/acyl hydrolase/lysophospholipase n=1 Tax=Podospora fimiseda TaxID=252190 RepID=A0AAN7BK35_9PEZI|nr:acyl transferase/acyl hydrolase/lysophospholipase [Podospora fimiseda]
MADQNSALFQSLRGWSKVNVLTFDGGGVRGYYSLLQLDKLMECIAVEEHRLLEEEPEPRSQTAESLSSFSPHPMPQHVNHTSASPPNEQLPPQASFLPCHYFDYIGGTSTGALITMMLGRFRMSAHDCLREYETLAGVIFGHPRPLNEMSVLGAIGLVKKTKFKTDMLESAIKDVVKRRGERPLHRDDAEEMVFGTPRGLCRAIIFISRTVRTADSSNQNRGPSVKLPYIFRSYDNFRLLPQTNNHPTGNQARAASDPEQGPTQPRRASTLAVWKLARAATAAKFHFKPLFISLHDSEIVRKQSQVKKLLKTTDIAELVDAGLDNVNNPSEAVHYELSRKVLTDSKKFDTWVSIGTARGTRPEESGLINFLQHRVYLAGDTEGVHSRMDDLSASTAEENKGPFKYYRLNNPEGLPNVEMDDWKPSGSGQGSGEQTLGTIRESFNEYYSNDEVRDYFRRCARELVKTRRERTADQSLWERYALGTTYTCRQSGCKYEPDQTWEYREQFTTHLRTDHGMTSQTDISAACQAGSLVWKYKARTDAQNANIRRGTTFTNGLYAG